MKLAVVKSKSSRPDMDTIVPAPAAAKNGAARPPGATPPPGMAVVLAGKGAADAPGVLRRFQQFRKVRPNLSPETLQVVVVLEEVPA